MIILNFNIENPSDIAGKFCAFLSGFIQVMGTDADNSKFPIPSLSIVNDMTGAASYER